MVIMYGILKDTYQNNNTFFWLTKLDLHLIHFPYILYYVKVRSTAVIHWCLCPERDENWPSGHVDLSVNT